MSKRYTQRQGDYLAFIHAYSTLNRRPPAVADIASFFDVSPPSAQAMGSATRGQAASHKDAEGSPVYSTEPPAVRATLSSLRRASIKIPVDAVLVAWVAV